MPLIYNSILIRQTYKLKLKWCTLYLFLVLCLSCSNSKNTPSNQHKLKVDTAHYMTNLESLINDSKLENGSVFGEDSTFFFAYLKRHSNTLVIRSLFNNNYQYCISIKNLIDSVKETEFIITYHSGLFYLFPLQEAYYYTLSFQNIKNRQNRFTKIAAPFLSFFIDTAYFSSSSEERIIPTLGNNLIIPYRLQNANNENLVDSTQFCLYKGFKNQNYSKIKFGKYPMYAYQHYNNMVGHIYTMGQNRNLFYFTNKKSDSINVYDIDSNTLFRFKIPETKNTFYEKDFTHSKIDYIREYIEQNDINLKLLSDEKGTIYLIRRKASPKKNQKFELICFSKTGKKLDSVILKSNKLDVTFSFLYQGKIYIPNIERNNYFVITTLL